MINCFAGWCRSDLFGDAWAGCLAGSPEFDLFIREIVREMTMKAGQKCTAIRRALVPVAHFDAAQAALTKALAEIVVGDPRTEGVKIGALVSRAQLYDVREKVRELQCETRIVLAR